MFGMLDISKMAGAAVLGAIVAAGPVYVYGKREGRQAERVAALESAVEAYAKREGIEHEVDGMDRYRICRDLGGLPEQCGQLRGVEEAAAGE